PPTSTLFPYTTLFRSSVAYYTLNVYYMTVMATKNRYIELLDELALEGKEVFTTHDVQELGQFSPQAASNLLTRLVHQGLVDRVRSEEHTSELQSRRDL